MNPKSPFDGAGKSTPMTPPPVIKQPPQAPDFGDDPRKVPTGRPTPSGPYVPPAVQ